MTYVQIFNTIDYELMMLLGVPMFFSPIFFYIDTVFYFFTAFVVVVAYKFDIYALILPS